MHWRERILNDPVIARLAAALKPGEPVGISGAVGSSAPVVAAAVAGRLNCSLLLVVAHLDEADEAAGDLETAGWNQVRLFPALEVLPGESQVSLELFSDRLEAVRMLDAGGEPQIIVAPVQALMQPVPSAEAAGKLFMELRRGQQMEPVELSVWLHERGYRRVDVIDEPGDFAVRGGLLDVFPPAGRQVGEPVRLDFFGDRIDQICRIDLDTMGSMEKLESVRLLGMKVDEGVRGAGGSTVPLWRRMPAGTVFAFREILEIEEQARGYYERLTDPLGIVAPQSLFRELNCFAQIQMGAYAVPETSLHFRLDTAPLPPFSQGVDKAVPELAALADESDGSVRRQVVLLCEKQAEADRLRELLVAHAGEQSGNVQLETGRLNEGFEWGVESGQPLAVISDHQVLHRQTLRRRIRRIASGRSMDLFLDLETDDWVVHAQHGIAIFRGLRLMKKSPEDPGEEYLTLEFAERALLHVPASQIELVQKYIGGFSGKPPLSKLGSSRWKNQKEQVAEAVKDLAAEMLRVQAARASQPGYRFPVDTPWQKSFEAEFPYQETDDQLAGMSAIRRDMSGERPMDRLICGDVGYGKTELAIRAAFVAAEAGRQVAVLCPTTVLCEQHERTFRQRMADYPFKIASLNRFRTASETRAVLEQVALGEVDIVIGTHRLLSDDVQFADLGLVVVDEEQRFGVEHKQRLMRYRMTVEVLTLSATPIPRTLHMSLLGLRDISSLATPPADRRSVVTDVVPHENHRIRKALIRELNRDGQCYYVHNRVQNIHKVAAGLRTLVPEARIEVGHGQMTGRELEEVMLRFVNREIDVLVCTTIIESGLDIPTANTIFIADCDRFGLAELHQLRGRVGRYRHRAYCYLLLPKSRPVSEVALKRLRAIEQYTMLGAGFKIAMADLEIRGAGNLLGPQQSGHIAAVGYEMYCRLLQQATAELQNQKPVDPILAHLELRVCGHLPKSYLPSDRHRMEVYRRIQRAADRESLGRVRQDLIEAFGPVPALGQVLFDLAEIRLVLGGAGVESLRIDEPDLVFTTPKPQALQPLLRRARGTVRVVDLPAEGRKGTVFYRPLKWYDGAALIRHLRSLLGLSDEPARKPARAGSGSLNTE